MLQLNDTQIAAALYEALTYHLATQACLAGAAGGQVYVDDLSAPRLALMRTGHRLYLSGDSQDERAWVQLRDFLRGELLPEAAKQGDEGFVLYYHDAGWQQTLPEQVFAGHKVYFGPRQTYELDHLTVDWQPPVDLPLPTGMRLEQDLVQLLARDNLEGREDLLEEMASERASVEDFVQHSFGTCIATGTAILGWCLSEYNLGARCEVGIAVGEGYRRRGLATMMGAAFIRQAITRGITRAGWHCWAGNSGSVMTARKLRMQLVSEHGAFFVPCSPESA